MWSILNKQYEQSKSLKQKREELFVLEEDDFHEECDVMDERIP